MADSYSTTTGGTKVQSFSNTVNGVASVNAMARVNVASDGKAINGRPYEINVSLTPVIGGSLAAGDVLCATQTISNFFVIPGVPAKITNAVLVDRDDQVVGAVAYFFKTSVALGTEDSAPSISDTNMLECRRRIAFAQSLADDLGGGKVWFNDYLDLTIHPENSSATDTYIALLLKELPTSATFASNLELYLTVVQ